MNCPYCQDRTPKNSNFCRHCGKRVQVRCPRCDKRLLVSAQFCHRCGLEMGQQAPEMPSHEPIPQTLPIVKQETPPPAARPAPATPLERFIPAELAQKLEAARSNGAMVGERRVVTMLFCDVKGSTAAAKKMDPEEWTEIINGAFEHMITPVYHYEGTVARLMGDGILAFFGAPIAHEDDPVRAVMAGLDIIAGFDGYQQQISRRHQLDIEVRVGINTGMVVVGAVGSDLRMEYTAMGDAINMAARMEQTAEPGTVRIGEETYRLVKHRFQMEDLGGVVVKGRDNPVSAYRVVQQLRQPERERGVEGLETPLIGRAAEWERIQSAADGLQRGVGQIIFLVGEAGLGKSRLIRELKHALLSPANESAGAIHWVEAASFSYEATQAYALIQRLVRRFAGISQTDSPAQMQAALLELAAHLPGSSKENRRVLWSLFGRPDEDGNPPLEGEGFQGQLYALLEALIQHQTEGQVLALICDDLHWSDAASIDLLSRLMPLVETRSLLLLCASRPDRDAPGKKLRDQAVKDHAHLTTEAHIRPLSDAEAQTLVEQLLAHSKLPSKLSTLIQTRAEGNPFFVEEVIRALIERRVLVPDETGEGWILSGWVEDLDIPSNLQALITARLDRLAEMPRRTLQIASVIGRTFYYRILDEIAQPSHESMSQPSSAERFASNGARGYLDSDLKTLQQAELIREVARIPEVEFMFRHSITQEATYNTILLRERRKFHQRVGEVIEQLYADQLDTFFPVLAHHFSIAEDTRAISYALKAGDQAFRMMALQEAQNHYDKASSLLQAGEFAPEPRTHLYLQQGRIKELQNDYPGAIEIYEEMQAMAAAHEAKKMTMQALTAQTIAYAIPTPHQNSEKAKRLGDQALELAHELGDRENEALIYWSQLLTMMYAGGMVEGIPLGEQTIALARELNREELLANALKDISLPYMAAWRFNDADNVLEEATQLWRKLGNLPMLAESIANRVLVKVMGGGFDEALRYMEEGFSISQQIGNEWGKTNSRSFAGIVYLRRGQIDRAESFLESTRQDAIGAGHPSGIYLHIQLAWLYSSIGREDSARQHADEALAWSRNFPPFLPASLSLMAHRAIQDGNLDQAAEFLAEAVSSGRINTLSIIEAQFELVSLELALARQEKEVTSLASALIERLENAGVVLFVPDACYLKARALLAEGKRDQALQVLAKAVTLSEKFEFRTWLWPLALLAAEHHTDPAEVNRFQNIAAGAIDFIAGQTSNETYQAAFAEKVRQFKETGIL